MPEYKVFGEPYQVRKEYPDRAGEDNQWWEYRIMLLDSEGDIVDEWNSLAETYNGMTGQRLTLEGCRAAIAEIRQAVAVGNAADWFTLPVEHMEVTE